MNLGKTLELLAGGPGSGPHLGEFHPHYNTVSKVVAPYGMSAVVKGDLVHVLDKKGRLAGTVDKFGTLERKAIGNQQLMGSLVRDAIKKAITG
jgi:hypothetical protein